jgi:hypothetical protein
LVLSTGLFAIATPAFAQEAPQQTGTGAPVAEAARGNQMTAGNEEEQSQGEIIRGPRPGAPKRLPTCRSPSPP